MHGLYKLIMLEVPKCYSSNEHYFQQYRIQHIQNQQIRHYSNQGQQPQSTTTTIQHVTPIISSAHNCPAILEGHIVCMGDCTFSMQTKLAKLSRAPKECNSNNHKAYRPYIVTENTLIIDPEWYENDFLQCTRDAIQIIAERYTLTTYDRKYFSEDHCNKIAQAIICHEAMNPSAIPPII
jgi:hypothetical protein